MTAVSTPILVVDDDADHRALLATYLAADGYTAAEADNGEAALEFIARQPVSLVLLDVMLPGLSGFDVCRRIKRDPKSAGVAVVMVTALGDTESRTKAFNSDADEYIAKPVFRLELLARVRAIMRLRRTQLDKDAALQALEAAQKRDALREVLERYLEAEAVERLLQLPGPERDGALRRALELAATDGGR